jgi:hypothetical protein
MIKWCLKYWYTKIPYIGREMIYVFIMCIIGLSTAIIRSIHSKIKAD